MAKSDYVNYSEPSGAQFYKDTKRNRWYFRMYVFDETLGKRRQIQRNGFNTQREAKAAAKALTDNILNKADILLFNDLVDEYFEDFKTRYKATTVDSKITMFDKYITPYFQNKNVLELTPLDIRNFQNELLKIRQDNGHPLSPSYIRTIDSQMRAILNYAAKYHGLKASPAANVSAVGSKKSNKDINFWTLDQFKTALATTDESTLDRHRSKCCLLIAFYTGIRRGELLALTLNDIDTDANVIKIRNNWVEPRDTNGIMTTPKTASSIRDIPVPKWLIDYIVEYSKRLYQYQPNQRLFEVRAATPHKWLKKIIKDSNMPAITWHDLRHSHASMLINHGANVAVLQQRLGHANMSETLDTYSHMYPNAQLELVKLLDNPLN